MVSVFVHIDNGSVSIVQEFGAEGLDTGSGSQESDERCGRAWCCVHALLVTLGGTTQNHGALIISFAAMLG